MGMGCVAGQQRLHTQWHTDSIALTQALISVCTFASLQYLVREHMAEDGMPPQLKSMGNSIIRKLTTPAFHLNVGFHLNYWCAYLKVLMKC
jgi:hypothetical protein